MEERFLYALKLVAVAYCIAAALGIVSETAKMVWLWGHIIGFVRYYILMYNRENAPDYIAFLTVPLMVEEWVVERLDRLFIK